MPLRPNWFFVVCFFLCPVAAMHGQASFIEQVLGTNSPGPDCNKSSTTKLAISCSTSWVNEGTQTEGSSEAIAKNAYGTMRAYAFSSVTFFENGSAAGDSGNATDIALDHLSILGLDAEPTAFLKFTFECLDCIQYNYPFAYYTAYAASYGPCQIYGIGSSPLCTLTVPIVYDGDGQPSPVYLQRSLQVNAPTSVTNGAAGATVTTTVCVGYSAGGCGTSGATVKASVVNAKGKAIKGVTVVGSSGHIYN
jgi:hypothetical protein